VIDARVRRYPTHAIAVGAPLKSGALLAMDRRIRVGPSPQQVELRLTIDAIGAPRTVCIMRWGKVGRQDFGYIPFGGELLAERRFGPFTLPSRVRIGWWFGTPRYRPFIEATIRIAERIA
jgi:hypothetical protein